MTTASASAAGKVILFGEHAVVYGRPAIAAPLAGRRAWATVTESPPGSGCAIFAADLERRSVLASAELDDPLAQAARLTLAWLGIADEPDCIITIRSDIPIASGLGSGAALSTAVVRALASHFGQVLPAAAVCELVYETERLYHGTPSGIDNTVIAYEQPIYYVRGRRPEPLQVGADMTLVIADTGVRSRTKLAVADVRRAWQADTKACEALFDEIAQVVTSARRALANGDAKAVGQLMNRNQQLLEDLGVSSPMLGDLCEAATQAGAFGAKLTGAGRGGNMVALASQRAAHKVITALEAVGAVGVFRSQLVRGPA